MSELNLVVDYMNSRNITLKEAREELKRVGEYSCSPLELLDRIGFEHDYIMDALEFVNYA